jgi:nucleoside-diphosphate-sugar epimerase
MRKVLVTGGSGKLGRFVCSELAPVFEVTVLDRIKPEADLPSIVADVRDLSALHRAARDHDAIVHLAGIPSPRHGADDEIISINAFGTWSLLQAALSAGVARVIVCSSDFVTGLLHSAPPVMPLYLPVDEAHPAIPTDAYGLSKHLAEQTALAFARRGLEIVILRPGLIVFPGMEEQALAAGERIDDPDLWWYASARDVATAFRLALESSAPTPQTFFIGAPNTRSAVPTLELVQRRYGRLPQIRNPDLYRDDPHAALFDISLARRALGFHPRDDWRSWARGTAPS